jgi:hypothetical protein
MLAAFDLTDKEREIVLAVQVDTLKEFAAELCRQLQPPLLSGSTWPKGKKYPPGQPSPELAVTTRFSTTRTSRLRANADSLRQSLLPPRHRCVPFTLMRKIKKPRLLALLILGRGALQARGWKAE